MNLETDNPEKGQLLQKSAHHQHLLEQEVKLISERSEKIITNALIIGGALALTYFLVSGLSGSSEKKRSRAKKIKLVATPDGSDPAPEETDQPSEAGMISQIGSVLVAQATGFILSVAREKLVEYLQSQGTKKGNSNEHS